MRHARIPLLALALAAVLAPALPAEHRTVSEVRIAVSDPRTGRELAVLSPGDTLELPPGEQRTLRLFSPLTADNRERQYLPAQFGYGPTQSAIETLREDRQRGEATVRLRPGARWDGRLHVGYRLGDGVELADEDLRLGRLLVDVEARSSADEVTAALYRAILMREPDAGAATRRDDIARNGYAGVVRQAREIAASRESEIDVYTRGACNQQRLLALYQHLLGRDARSIDQRLWRQQLRHLEGGDVVSVVDDMLESPEFAQRFGYRQRMRRG